MTHIEICRSHDKSPAEARAAVERVADHIAERFSVRCGWDGETLRFDRSGVHGEIELQPSAVRVSANLGFMLMALRGPIEAEIHRYLDEEFG